jgi:hypothetical protein
MVSEPRKRKLASLRPAPIAQRQHGDDSATPIDSRVVNGGGFAAGNPIHAA